MRKYGGLTAPRDDGGHKSCVLGLSSGAGFGPAPKSDKGAREFVCKEAGSVILLEAKRTGVKVYGTEHEVPHLEGWSETHGQVRKGRGPAGSASGP